MCPFPQLDFIQQINCPFCAKQPVLPPYALGEVVGDELGPPLQPEISFRC